MRNEREISRDDYIKLESKYQTLQLRYRIIERNGNDFFDYMNTNYPDEVNTYFEREAKK